MISTKGCYAMRIMIDICEHGGEGYNPLKDIVYTIQYFSVFSIEIIIIFQQGIDQCIGPCSFAETILPEMCFFYKTASFQQFDGVKISCVQFCEYPVCFS
jgi:hypothetical protein